MHVVCIIWHHPLQRLPGDGSHPHRRGRRGWRGVEICFKERAASAGEKVTVQMEEEQRGGRRKEGREGKKYKSQWQGQPAYCSTLHSVFMEMWHIPTAMDGSHSKTHSIHKHWLFISQRNWISQKVDLTARARLHHVACRLSQDGTEWSCLRAMLVLLSLMWLCSVLLADSWHSTRHTKHNPPTWNQIVERNGI